MKRKKAKEEFKDTIGHNRASIEKRLKEGKKDYKKREQEQV